MTEQTGDIQGSVRGSSQRNGAAEASVSHRGGLYFMDGQGEGQEPLGGGRGCSQLSGSLTETGEPGQENEFKWQLPV